MSELRTFSTFRIGHLRLALPVDRVQEVVRRQDLTGVPLAPAAVEGLINLRGQIVTALSLTSLLLGRPEPAGQTALIVRVGEELLAMLVDEVGDVIDVADADVAPVPDTIGPPLAGVATGVVASGGVLLVIVDLDMLLGALR